MALSAEVVDLIWLHLLDDPDQVGAVDEVAVMEHQSRVALVWILVQVIDPLVLKLLARRLMPCTW